MRERPRRPAIISCFSTTIRKCSPVTGWNAFSRSRPIPRSASSGPTLLYPDRTIQHAGILPRSDGMWIHAYQGLSATLRGGGGVRTVRVVPAVTAACLLTRRGVR